MKIVTKKEFLKLPPYTLYAEYEPSTLGHIYIKKESIGESDFNYLDFIHPLCDPWGLHKMEEDKTSLPVEICESRDGLFEDDALYMIYDKEDVKKIIEVLQECIK